MRLSIFWRGEFWTIIFIMEFILSIPIGRRKAYATCSIDNCLQVKWTRIYYINTSFSKRVFKYLYRTSFMAHFKHFWLSKAAVLGQANICAHFVKVQCKQPLEHIKDKFGCFLSWLSTFPQSIFFTFCKAAYFTGIFAHPLCM